MWNDDLPLEPATDPARRLQLAIKRGLDIGLALTGLVLVSPLLLVLALLIKLGSRGPVLFRQQRVGYRGNVFSIYKFRTLHVEDCDAAGIRQIRSNDRRTTSLGRVMRATSLDELPQLINVVLGDMSLVGPRPHVAGMLAAGVVYEELVPYYGLRHAMRPGMTGWAQANGLRGPTDDAEKATARVDHDLAYIQQFSLWLDLKTLVLTVRECVCNSGI